MKACPSCGHVGPVESDFGFRRPGGPANSYCRACASKRARDWARKNPGRPRTENRQKARERKRRWLEKNRDKANAATKRRDAEHPEQKAERTRRRRARIAGATTSPVDYAVILAAHGRFCHICREPIIGPIDFDHVIPIARGGSHDSGNIRPSHPSCNRRKGARLLCELASNERVPVATRAAIEQETA